MRPRQKFVGDAGLGKGGPRIGWLGWSCVTSTWRLAGPMTGDSVPLAGLLAKAGGDFLRSVAEPVGPSLTETDVEGVIGGGRHERGGEHRACRNGHRDPAPGTRAGRPQRRIPGRRQDRGFPPFPEHRKAPEKARSAVIQDAWAGAGSRMPERHRNRCQPERLDPEVADPTRFERAAFAFGEFSLPYYEILWGTLQCAMLLKSL